MFFMKKKYPFQIRHLFYLFAVIFCSGANNSFATLADNYPDTDYRKTISLNGVWDFIPEGLSQTTIDVPDCWQGKKALDERLAHIATHFPGVDNSRTLQLHIVH